MNIETDQAYESLELSQQLKAYNDNVVELAVCRWAGGRARSMGDVIELHMAGIKKGKSQAMDYWQETHQKIEDLQYELNQARSDMLDADRLLAEAGLIITINGDEVPCQLGVAREILKKQA